MANRKSKRPPPKDPNQAIAELEQPTIKWKVVAQIAVGFAILWVVAIGLMQYGLGIWPPLVAGVLTLVAAGFGVYILRLTRRSRAIIDILKTATDEEGRKEALQKLEGSGKKDDAMRALARAQLLARESPQEAMEALEEIDLKKAPAVVQDDVRANLALLYLSHNRIRDARELADEIRLDRQPQAKAKALYAAVVAESFARTGKSEEAKKLLETYDPADPEFGEMSAMLYRAQVYTYTATKNRGMARTAMQRLAAIDPNMLGVFVVKGTNPALSQMARQLLGEAGAIPKQKMRMRMR